MATAQLLPPHEPQQRKWTREEFYRLLDLGFFVDQRVELIEGEIIQMAAQKNFHAISMALTNDELRAAFGPGFWVRVQMSLDLTPYSVPDPDLAVVPGTPRSNMTQANPTSALLITEVSETTLAYDRRTKGSFYAVAGIADYWIVNLVDRQLEIYPNPVPDAQQIYGMGYAGVVILGPRDHATPLAAPHAKVLVANLLP
jgi:Uma2 family endonuclease